MYFAINHDSATGLEAIAGGFSFPMTKNQHSNDSNSLEILLWTINFS